MPGLARIQREEKDVLRGRIPADGVQVIECPYKQTSGRENEKRYWDLGDHQNLLRGGAGRPRVHS